MVSVSILMIGGGAAFIYAAWKCVKLAPLLHGDYQEGDHCTGSLIAIAGALLLAIIGKVGGQSIIDRLLKRLPPVVVNPKTPPTEAPPPEEPPVEIPPVEVP